MNRKPLLALAAVTAATGALATGIAVGSGGGHVPDAVPASQLAAVAPASSEVLAAFPAFDTPESSPAKDAITDRIQQGFASDPDTPEAQADLDLARSVTIATGETVWMAPSGDRVCVFIPDPVDGLGASCPTLDQINDGHGTVVLGAAPGGSGTFVVAVPTPEGADGPEIVHADRSHSTVVPQDNLAVAVADSTDAVQTSGDTIALSELGPQAG